MNGNQGAVTDAVWRTEVQLLSKVAASCKESSSKSHLLYSSLWLIIETIQHDET